MVVDHVGGLPTSGPLFPRGDSDARASIDDQIATSAHHKVTGSNAAQVRGYSPQMKMSGTKANERGS